MLSLWPCGECGSLTKALFPFELTTNDYAHRGLDLLTTLLLGTCVRAVQFVSGFI